MNTYREFLAGKRTPRPHPYKLRGEGIVRYYAGLSNEGTPVSRVPRLHPDNVAPSEYACRAARFYCYLSNYRFSRFLAMREPEYRREYLAGSDADSLRGVRFVADLPE